MHLIYLGSFNRIISFFLIFVLLAQPLSALAGEISHLTESINPFSTIIPSASSQTYVNQGSFLYERPIELPQGISGLTPTLTLAYNSARAGEHGIYGAGWSDTIPYIEAVNKAGLSALYDYDHIRSSLDGELLKISSSTYTARVSTEGINEYQKNGNTWIVTEPSGTERAMPQFG